MRKWMMLTVVAFAGCSQTASVGGEEASLTGAAKALPAAEWRRIHNQHARPIKRPSCVVACVSATGQEGAFAFKGLAHGGAIFAPQLASHNFFG